MVTFSYDRTYPEQNICDDCIQVKSNNKPDIKRTRPNKIVGSQHKKNAFTY